MKGHTAIMRQNRALKYELALEEKVDGLWSPQMNEKGLEKKPKAEPWRCAASQTRRKRQGVANTFEEVWNGLWGQLS